MIIRFIGWFLGASLLLSIVSIGAILYLLNLYGRALPDYQSLLTYEPPTMTRVHASDGKLIMEYANEPRVFVPISVIPSNLINAFLAAEDGSFYRHQGIDLTSIFRAIITNLSNFGKDRRPVGASTITQQVAKNFFLSNEVSFERKIKEAILAFRIERALTKDRILELYLNEIYLGYSSYGVAAAALSYFDKSLDQLNLEEVAYLAALPKAPSHYHPLRNPKLAKQRRNWVLSRMADEKFISYSVAQISKQRPLVVSKSRKEEFVKADFFLEEVRRELFNVYGERGLYEGGLSVRTSLDPNLQAIASEALRSGLRTYDKRHGWRGPLGKITFSNDWSKELIQYDLSEIQPNWISSVVLEINDDDVKIGFVDGSIGFIDLKELLWARDCMEGQKIGKPIKHPSDVLSTGDVILVESLLPAESKKYSLRQIPDVQGAIVALDPHTGRVLAMSGGYDFNQSEFNRATQALRQPGSAFKPFVYLAALENGFSPSSKVLDGPFVVDQGKEQGWWKPANYTNKFYGPSTLRLGIEKSRNLMTVRLAQFLGMEIVSDYAQRFGIMEDMPLLLSMSLGAGETTLLKLTAAYAMLVNGGKNIETSFIDRIQDRRGKTIMRQDRRKCDLCKVSSWKDQVEPMLPDQRNQIVSPEAAYQVVSMLEGVVKRGTGRSINKIKKHLAGKTGTTNEGVDAWFIGFSADLVVGVFVGFDKPKSLGPSEQGASVAAPIFSEFMSRALINQSNIPFRIPNGVRLVRIDASTGLAAGPDTKKVLLEAFRPGSEPRELGPVLDGSKGFRQQKKNTGSGTGGLY
tara:strand:+ start:289 stop:2697 length:2409 start_codon:yes stop_codon:yes gene_type:complete